jgi:uncharacterized phage protein gp47/JayE
VPLTPTGIEISTLEEIQNEINALLYANVSSELDLTANSLDGEFVGAVSSQARRLHELALALHSSRSPSQAEGEALDAICEITGTYRNAATYSLVACTVTISSGTHAPGTLIAHPVGAPDRRFSNTAEISATGSYVFQAEVTGPQRADAGTLTVIAESVAGFDAITNPADADLGAVVENDTSLRRRRALELARPGSTTVDAIRADVLDVSDVTLCTVYENDLDVTNGDGIPAHSIEAVVLGGTDAAVRAAVFGAKAAGIRAYGSNSGTVTDTQGNVHTVAFSRPTNVNIWVSATLTYISGLYPGDAAIKSAIADWADSFLSVGNDVLRARLFGEFYVAGSGGIVNISSLTLGTSASPVGTSDLVMTVRQLARFDTSRIVITSSAVAGPP